MRTLTYYIAATIDGFIAGPDGQFDFFPLERDVANKRFDTILMGRGTYDVGLREGITSPYPHLKQYVFSRTLTGTDPQVEIVSGDPVEFVRELKQQKGMGIWLCGGGRLAGQLLPEIDELVIKRNPLVIGSGIPLFDGPFDPTRFTPISTRAFATGVAIVTYTRS